MGSLVLDAFLVFTTDIYVSSVYKVVIDIEVLREVDIIIPIFLI